MSDSEFYQLIVPVKDNLVTEIRQLREPIPVKTKMSFTLHYLATGNS